MIILEIIAMIFTLICVYLTGKQNIWCWLTGIIGIICFFILFSIEKFYFQAILQVIFFFQSIYGWLMWKKNNINGTFIVKRQEIVKLITQLTIMTTLGVITGYIMGAYTSSILPILDSIITFMAILATYYLGKQYIEAWIVWMGVNILLGGMLIYQGLYMIALLECILFIISFNAYKQWRRDLKTVCV